MTKLFNDIMVPIFSTEELDTHADKVIEISKQLQCNIHFLYVNREHRASIFKKAGLLLSNQKKTYISANPSFLDTHKRRLMKLDPSLSFHCTMRNESLQHVMVDYCNKHNIDLVLFLEKKESGWELKREKFNIAGLSEKLECPVLGINFKSNMLAIKNIVIPIGSFLPMKKLIVACYIGRLFNSKIHLVSLNKKFLLNGREEAVSLYKAYHLLHDNTNLPVECITLMSKNIDEATFRYAEEINADLVFVSSDKESISDEMMN